ncbi:hypothetical protein ATANTOWER_021597 [Ataeniobius toweri]|uniref:Uncharacterized protein n=1 Tax=Ataeniobius toweri TaxID=208326 RepID=A0ABU7BGX2_9TELE|nr:hypothetical protein [Ataeniobius toweri]
MLQHHVCGYTVSQIQVLLNKTVSGQILIQHTRPHLASKDTKIGWGANSLFLRTPLHAHKFLLSLHSNHPNATPRQDDNSVNSSKYFKNECEKYPNHFYQSSPN